MTFEALGRITRRMAHSAYSRRYRGHVLNHALVIFLAKIGDPIEPVAGWRSTLVASDGGRAFRFRCVLFQASKTKAVVRVLVYLKKRINALDEVEM